MAQRSLTGSKQNTSLSQKVFEIIYVLSSLIKISKVQSSNDNTLQPLNEPAIFDLGSLFDANGSDKGTHHGYNKIYEKHLTKYRLQVSYVLEIGIGSNNLRVPSNMGAEGIPGASLRVWKIFFPNARIFGADIDEGSFISEDNIKCFYVDQCSKKSLSELSSSLPNFLDVIIVDGLHTLKADFLTTSQLISKLSLSGFIFVEDVSKRTKLVWKLVKFTLRRSFELKFHTCNAEKTLLLSIQRIR